MDLDYEEMISLIRLQRLPDLFAFLKISLVSYSHCSFG